MIEDRKKIIKILVLAVLVLVFFAVLFTAGILRWPKPPKPPYNTGGSNITSARDAYDAAATVAKGWHEDAVLSSLLSKPQEGSDKIENWRFIFMSPAAQNKGFIVEVSRAKVESFQEISYSGTAAQFPENIISQGEAIQRIHALKGYENEPILGLEAVYDPARHSWFWAAKTPRGTVSVDAKP